MAEKKSICFERSENIKCIVNVDEEIIRRVFANLLSNAVKFSPKNGKIRIFTTIEGNNNARIVITNEGPSIPKEKRKAIFEKFVQAEKKDQGSISSTGLGLTFCKMAIEAHGGEIGVISEEDENVAFWFTLPDSSCIGCSNCKQEIEKKAGLELSVTDKEYLKLFITLLENKQVYEVTAINTILKDIEPKNRLIEIWLKELEHAIYQGDGEKYNHLLSACTN